jgi:hypothetical protein
MRPSFTGVPSFRMESYLALKELLTLFSSLYALLLLVSRLVLSAVSSVSFAFESSQYPSYLDSRAFFVFHTCFIYFLLFEIPSFFSSFFFFLFLFLLYPISCPSRLGSLWGCVGLMSLPYPCLPDGLPFLTPRIYLFSRYSLCTLIHYFIVSRLCVLSTKKAEQIQKKKNHKRPTAGITAGEQPLDRAGTRGWQTPRLTKKSRDSRRRVVLDRDATHRLVNPQIGL